GRVSYQSLRVMKKAKAKPKEGVDAPANWFRTLLLSLDPAHRLTLRSAGWPAQSVVIFLSLLLLVPLLVFLKRPFHLTGTGSEKGLRSSLDAVDYDNELSARRWLLRRCPGTTAVCHRPRKAGTICCF